MATRSCRKTGVIYVEQRSLETSVVSVVCVSLSIISVDASGWFVSTAPSRPTAGGMPYPAIRARDTPRRLCSSSGSTKWKRPSVPKAFVDCDGDRSNGGDWGKDGGGGVSCEERRARICGRSQNRCQCVALSSRIPLVHGHSFRFFPCFLAVAGVCSSLC